MSTVLITGANRGLGLEFARQYAADGWEVLATTRRPTKSAELKQLRKSGRVSVHKLDVTSDASVKKLVEALEGKAIDVLILNSGVFPRDGHNLGAIDYEGWREAFETNVLGVIRVAEALVEKVAASERKQICAISTALSSLDILPATFSYGTAYQYRTSKTALNMAMSVLAKEVEPRGISVTIFDPGWVKTDMGGPNAVLTPEQSIGGMRRVLAGNAKELAGKFIGHDGAARRW